MEPVSVEGFGGFWSATVPDRDRVRLAPLAAHRVEELVDLTCRRLAHMSRTEAEWMFTAGDVMQGLTVLAALDRHDRLVGWAATAHPAFAPEGRSFLRPRALAVARHWGFGLVEHSIESELALDDLPEPVLPVGVTLEEAPDFGFEDRDAVEAMLLRSQTNPEAQQGWVFDLQKLASFVTSKEVPICVLARVDGAPAGITVGAVAEGVLSIAYSGVDPTLRGRGLMRIIKQQAHRAAARAGATVSRTNNEEHNVGIRRVNAELGYVVRSGVYRMSAPVAG